VPFGITVNCKLSLISIGAIGTSLSKPGQITHQETASRNLDVGNSVCLAGLPIPYIEVLIGRTRRPFIYPELVIESSIYGALKDIETVTEPTTAN
jgi:hypothetical protein